jgi:hypothetical protein
MNNFNLKNLQTIIPHHMKNLFFENKTPLLDNNIFKDLNESYSNKLLQQLKVLCKVNQIFYDIVNPVIYETKPHLSKTF